ncbi:MAG: uroporphyrinogen decarboxylase family protein [Moorellaceae bacterium]
MSLDLYGERLERIKTAAHLGVPDRVPVLLGIDFFSARHKGMKTAEFIWSGEKGADLILETALELGADGVLFAVPAYPIAMVVGAHPTRMKLPGRQLGDDEIWQFDESSPVMEIDDYDFVIKHGWNAFVPRLIERCVDFMSPSEAFSRLEQLSEVTVRAISKFRDNGLPVLVGMPVTPPSQLFSAARTIGEFFKDLRRYPQKVMEAMEAALPDIIETAMMTSKSSGAGWVFIGDARDCGQFVSLQMYEKFFHPFLVRMVDAFVKAGLEVLLHFDSDWTKNLPYFRDFPAGKCILHLDGSTDIFKAKELLGGHIALKGDVPPSLLTLGTPEKVDAYCKRLIEEIGRGGGFILSQGCDVPINAKFENVKAMVDAAHKYGVYERG